MGSRKVVGKIVNRTRHSRLGHQAAIVFASTLLAPSLALAGLCDGLISHKKELAVPKVAKPPFRSYYREPAFGTKVMRITDSREHGVFKPVYSTVQAWNADESYLVLYKSVKGQQAHFLLDGKTYEILKPLDIYPSDLEDVFWSHTDPRTLYFSSKAARRQGRLYSYDVVTDKKTLIKDFKALCRGTMASPGNDVQMQSFDDDLFGFRCLNNRSSEKKYTAFTYRISTGEVNSMKLGPGTDWDNWTAPVSAPSGKSVFFQGYVMSPDLTQKIHKLDMKKYSEHGNIGKSHNGQDALYQVTFNASPKGCDGDSDKGIGHLTEYNMETGKCRTIISEDKGYPYTTSATHISAQAYKNPGWIALSSVGYPKQFKYLDNNKRATVFFSEIYLASTDPDDPVVCRLAHHRSKGKHADEGDYPAYFGEPHVTISPSGTRLLFGSDWYDSGAVDTYVIELPDYVR